MSKVKIDKLVKCNYYNFMKINYIKRITDELLKEKLSSFGGVLIAGPKGCGKTTSAKRLAKTIIEFQDEEKKDYYLTLVNTMVSKLLANKKPILFDEWQDAPKTWGAARKYIDDNQEIGSFIFTGSSSAIVNTPHTGTLRISTLNMYPMSLFESGESNGTVSLSKLIDTKEVPFKSDSKINLDDLIFAICRGGWPSALIQKTKKGQLNVAKEIYDKTISIDISKIRGVKRDKKITKQLLKSYSRNICTLAENTTIIKDINGVQEITKPTYYDYVYDLEELHIIEDIEAWSPAIRSKTAIRRGRKRNLIDPSIAVAALNLSPEYFNQDFNTLGFLFESLCVRDLRIYSMPLGGEISYYHDRSGLEVDIVLHLNNGRYALIECKLGHYYVEEAAQHLNKIEKLIIDYNKETKNIKMRLPDLKIVITGDGTAYKRDDNVFVIPIGTLKP